MENTGSNTGAIEPNELVEEIKLNPIVKLFDNIALNFGKKLYNAVYFDSIDQLGQVVKLLEKTKLKYAVYNNNLHIDFGDYIRKVTPQHKLWVFVDVQNNVIHFFTNEEVKDRFVSLSDNVVNLDCTVYPSNEKTIYVEDDIEYNGAHTYYIQNSKGFNNGKAEYDDTITKIDFIKKLSDGTIVSGVQSEQLALILMDRAIKLNARFPSPQNEKMIEGLQMFLDACKERIDDRLERGVMGDLKK